MVLYVYEKRVWEGILTVGLTPEEPNSTARIEVLSPVMWTGTLELDDPSIHIPDSGVFHDLETDEKFAVRVEKREGRTVHVSKFATGRPSPGRASVRSEIGSVQIILHGQLAGRGLAELEVFNDDSWKARIRLEGSGLALNPGDRFNIRADGSDLMTVARVDEIGFASIGESASFGFDVTSWEDNPPPF